MNGRRPTVLPPPPEDWPEGAVAMRVMGTGLPSTTITREEAATMHRKPPARDRVAESVQYRMEGFIEEGRPL